MAEQLAARSGGKYTVEQIEEQLRLSGVNGTDIQPGSDMVATKDGIYDPSAKWVDLGNGQYVQQFAKLDLDLVAYIRASTSNYTWAAFPVAPDHDWSKTPNVSDELRDRLSGRVLDTQGGFRSPVLVDGEAFYPHFLPCGDASCVASGAGLDLNDPETQRWISAGNAKAANAALAVGSLAPLPMAWVGKVLGSVFGKGVASEAIGGGSSAVVAKGLGEIGAAKGVSPVVTAEGKIGGTTFTDFNQTARPASEANASQPTLISDRVTAKADASGKILPNGNMADAHAELGVLQQAYNSGKTQGADMAMSVAGKDVCGFCKGDIAAAAEKAGLKSLTVQAIDDVTGLPKTYNWVPGMRSIKETP